MKRLLTYGLLMLTILASHFVVSACQDDLPETTEVMMTFTTRAVTQGAASTAPDKERMKDLHVIMLRSDGTIVGNHTEPKITASSVTFTFSTPIKTTGEDFTFLAIANENNIGKTLVNGNLEIGDKLSTGDIEELTMNANLNAIDALPQTKLWTVHVPQTQNHHVNQTLDFVGSKISVVFNNQTEEPQSLSNIYISGIGSASEGYLFAQNSNDFVGTQHDASATITFTDVTQLATKTTSELTYYTYPVGSVSSPTLYAEWNGKTYDLPITKVKDQNGNEIDFTSLKRNDHLRIEITLTPAQDITVNYTIVPWEENATNIGGEAPTTPGNGYHVDDFGEGGIIDVGGGGGKIWDLGDGTSIRGESSLDTIPNAQFSANSYININTVIDPEKHLQLGNVIIVYFLCPYKDVYVQFLTGWSRDLGDEKTLYTRSDTELKTKYLTITDPMGDIPLNEGYESLVIQNLAMEVTDGGNTSSVVEDRNHIQITQIAVVKPSQ